MICGLFLAVNAYLLVRDMYWTLLIPAGVVLAFLYFYRLDIILFLVTFVTPVAINMTSPEYGLGVSLPSEPLMLGVLVMFLVKMIYEGHYDRRILRHPLTIIILIDLTWIFITSMTSQLPVVSFKFLLARLWFVVPFYFLGILLFKNLKNIKVFMWLYILPLLFVIGYTTYHHYLLGFDEQAGHWVMEPFYNDHTAYGVILTLYIPVFTGFAFTRINSWTWRFFSLIVLVILIGALILSFSRAAWVSLAFAMVVFIVVLLRIKFKWIFLTLLLITSVFLLFQNQIWDRLEKNKQGSSANFVEHVQSISNISTDDSNLERINRWQSAIRMFSERPVFGFGPGTYQFEYAPYQHSSEKTLISTNAGDRGNAHSEYIGPLSESGLMGMLCMITLVILMIITGLRIYKKGTSFQVKVLGLTVMLSLITYFFHGTMNNFLDSDKASVPVWGFIGILAALDVYFTGKDTGGVPDKQDS
jgi:O-antigen ligase